MEPSIIVHQGDGKTKTFSFGFSFFQPADIIVEINGNPSTIQYALEIGKPNKFADMPYYGGTVCFASAPKNGDEIKIYREIVLTRPVDYQETVQPTAYEMNQDSNFHLENIRDLRRRQKITDNKISEQAATIADIIERMTSDENSTSDIPNVPTTPTTPSVDLTGIENKISELENTISELTAQLETRAPQSAVTQIQSSVAALDDKCENLSNQIENMPAPTLPDDVDYVVESQLPTVENNYTWYRKYASGWVEQGGYTNAQTITLPVSMHDTNYSISLTGGCEATNNNVTVYGFRNKTTTDFIVQGNILNSKSASSNANTGHKFWRVYGLAEIAKE